MTEYVLFHGAGAAGPDFNKASSILRDKLKIEIKDSNQNGPFASLLVETDKTIPDLQDHFPGWNIFPNVKL